MTSAKGVGGSNKNKNTSSSGNASPGQGRRNPNSGSLEDSQSAAAAQTRMAQTQQQVDEVVGIMRSNVEKVLERDRYLSDLDARAEALNAGAAEFSKTAVQLKRKYWWKNLKWIIILGLVIMLVVTGLAFWIASYFDGNGGNDGENATGKSLLNSTSTNITDGTYQMVLLKVNGTQLNLTPQK